MRDSKDGTMDKMHTLNEICEALSVSRRSIHHWIATGQLKAFHIGGKRLTRVWEKDLDRFVRGRARAQAKRSRGR